MKVTFEKTKMQIDIVDFVESLDDEAKKELAKALAFGAALIQAAVNCAIEAPSAFDDGEPWWFSRETNSKLRESLLPLMPAIVHELVRELAAERVDAVADRQRWDRWAVDLWMKWPRSQRCHGCDQYVQNPPVPERPPFAGIDWPARAAVEREAEEKLAATGFKKPVSGEDEIPI